jgi:hypothetical protein
LIGPLFAIPKFLSDLRRDKTAGMLTGLFGLLMMSFAGLGLLIAETQQLIITQVGLPNDARGIAFKNALAAVHSIWNTYLPLTLAGGAVFAVAGYYLYRGSTVARRVAQFNALAGYVWTIAYLVAVCQAAALWHPDFFDIPEPFATVWKWTSIVLGTLMSLGIPTALLLLLSRPDEVQT